MPAQADRARAFFRLAYSIRRYDRIGNSHNPLFDYWSMYPRPIPALRGIPTA